MFDVTTINLNRDVSAADLGLGSSHVGEVAPAELTALLDRFRELDAVQNHEADPQIVIQTRSGKYIVRTGHRKLFLYNARDTTAAYTELDAPVIVDEISRGVGTEQVYDVEPTLPSRTKKPRRGIALSILASGLLLNGYTLYSVGRGKSINERPAVVFVADAREVTAVQNSAAGRYATGENPGDRAVEVTTDGRVRFFKLLTAGERLDGEDTYRVAQMESKPCLSTSDNGVIEITNIDSIVYYRDVYRRTK